MRAPWSKSERWRKDVSRLLAGLLIVVLFFGNRMLEEFPAVTGLEFLAGIILVGVGTIGRLWCSVYVAGNKTSELVTVGPYSVCRHPLYFFGFLGAVGVGLASETFTLPLTIVAFYSIYYPGVMRDEETKLLSIHGEKFNDYMRHTPAFFPRMSLLVEPEQYTTNVLVFRKHLLSALWFVWFIGILESVEVLQELRWIPTFFPLY